MLIQSPTDNHVCHPAQRLRIPMWGQKRHIFQDIPTGEHARLTRRVFPAGTIPKTVLRFLIRSLAEFIQLRA
jgi:hypothetical protein